MRKFTPPPIEIGKSTHVGMRRKENQDNLGYALLDKLPYDGAHLLVVADGMGGASGGEIASELAVEAVLNYFLQDTPNMEPDVAIREAIESGAISVAAKTKENPHLEGMGTTCVVVLVQNGYLFAGHIGDSRLYMLRDDVLHRLSRDHSAVQRLVEAGILTEEEARNHPRQNVLARVLGSDQPPLVEILAPPWKLKSGDRIMLCSDGLHGEVSDEVIAETLANYSAQEASDKLIELANANGGNDNITVEVLAYGPQQAPVHTENWYSFSNPTTGFLLHASFLLLFFIWGYVAGKYDEQLKAPKVRLAKANTKRTAQPRVITPRRTTARNAGAPCGDAAKSKKTEKCRISFTRRRVVKRPVARPTTRAVAGRKRTTPRALFRFKRSTPIRRPVAPARPVAPRPNVGTKPAVRQPDTRQPAARRPVARPTTRRPAARVVARPTTKRPAARTTARPAARRPVAVRQPAARPTTRTPVARPTTRQPVARPAARRPDPRQPAARRPAARPTSRPAARTTAKPAARTTKPAARTATPPARPTSRPAPSK